jgi:hypothetical protein
MKGDSFQANTIGSSSLLPLRFASLLGWLHPTANSLLSFSKADGALTPLTRASGSPSGLGGQLMFLYREMSHCGNTKLQNSHVYPYCVGRGSSLLKPCEQVTMRFLRQRHFQTQLYTVPVAERSIRRGSAAGRLLGSRFPVPPGGMDVCCECCVLSGRGVCNGPIPRTEKFYRL